MVGDIVFRLSFVHDLWCVFFVAIRRNGVITRSCTYHSADALDGWLTALPVISFGAIVRCGFHDVGAALKRPAETRLADQSRGVPNTSNRFLLKTLRKALMP